MKINKKPNEEGLSLDKVDALLNAEDPDFIKSLRNIGPGGSSDKNKIETDFGYTLEDEFNKWKQKSWLKKMIARFLPFLPKAAYKIKFTKFLVRYKIGNLKIQTKYFFTHFKPLCLGWIRRSISKSREFINDQIDNFSSFSQKKKIGLIVFWIIVGLSGNLIFKLINHKLIHVQKELFLLSLDEWAEEKKVQMPGDQVEAFYDSNRMVQHILKLKKIWVNIRPSTNSGPNPMAALEFYVEGTAAEVVIEIKDRETEVGDLFLRTIEELTYDQLASGTGKKMLCESLSKEINKLLTKGKVRHVFIKTAILKP